MILFLVIVLIIVTVVAVLVIQDRAKHLREEAARPVRYEVEPAQDETPASVTA